MIKKLHDEWEKLSHEARQSAVDPVRKQEILERMDAVSGALKRMAQGSVTRTSLSQAVREALGDVLRSEKTALLPELSSLGDDLAALRGSLEALSRRLEEAAERDDRLERLTDGLARRLEVLSAAQGSTGVLSPRSPRGDGEPAGVGPAGAEAERAAAAHVEAPGRNGGAEFSPLDPPEGTEFSPLGPPEGTFSPLGPPEGTEVNLLGLRTDLGGLEGEVASLRCELDHRRVGLAAELGGLRDELSSRRDHFQGALDCLRAELETRTTALEARLEALRGTAATRSSPQEGLEDAAWRLAALEERVVRDADRAGALEGRLAAASEEAGACLREMERAVGDRLERALGDVRSRLEALSPLEERARKLEEALDGFRSAGLGGEIQGLRDDLARRAEALGGDLGALRGDLDRRVGGLEEWLRGLGGELDGRTEELRRRTNEAAGHLEAIEETLEENARRLKEGLDGLNAEVDRRAGGMEDEARRLRESHDGLGAGLRDLDSRLSQALGAQEARFSGWLEALEGRLREGLGSMGRLVEVQGRTEGQLASLEEQFARGRAEVAEAVETKFESALQEVRALEERLDRKVRGIMDELQDKVSLLVNIAGEIRSSLPSREEFGGMKDRLASIQTGLHSLSDQVQGLQKAVPDLRSLSQEVSTVRSEVGGLASEVASSQREGREGLDLFVRRVQDVQDLLRSGMDRLEADRSSVRQRLVDLRDLLRDQIRSAAQRGEAASSGILAKLLARQEGGTQFSPGEWSRFRASLETSIQSLESILAETR